MNSDTKKHDLKCLAVRVLDTLGVDSAKVSTTEELYKQTLWRAQMELMVVSHVLEEDAPPATLLCDVVEGIHRRLELAGTCGQQLLELIADGRGLA